MEIKNCLPKFEKDFTIINVNNELKLFRKLYDEKATHMSQAKVLNFYGSPGAGRTRLMRALYNNTYNGKENAENKTGEKPESTSLPAGTAQPAIIYCNIIGGNATIISQIIKQSSKKYGFVFPLTTICLYILSRAGEEETGSAFPLSGLREVAINIEREPEFQYLKQSLDTLPLDQNSFTYLYNQLFFDDQAPRSLRQLAESNSSLLESLFRRPIRLYNSRLKPERIYYVRTAEQKQNSRLDYLPAFFTSFFAADMEENLKEHRLPAVIILDGIDTIFGDAPAASEQKEKEKWLCGTTGLLTTVPKTFWVLSSSKKLDWDKAYLPDWKGALTQKAIPSPKVARPDMSAKFAAAVWEQHKTTLDEKIQCVLQGLGIFDFHLAYNACTALIEEFQDFPEFETECRNRILKLLKNTNKDLHIVASREHVMIGGGRSSYFCYNPETVSESRQLANYKFKTFYFAQQYYAALISRNRLDNISSENTEGKRQTWKSLLDEQLHTVETLMDKTTHFISAEPAVQENLRDFYFTAVIPQVLDWIDLGLYSVAERILGKLKTAIANDNALLSPACALGYAYLQKVRDSNNAEAVKQIQNIYEKVLAAVGKEEPAAVYLLNILSYVRSFLPGQELVAYRERRQCARILKSVLGKTAKETIRAISILSPHLADCGRKEDAELLSKICLTKAEYLYGENDRVTLQCKTRYAFRLKANGNYREAAQMQESVANQYETMSGNYNPITLSALKSLAATLYTIGQETEYDEENEIDVIDFETRKKELRIREAIFNRYQSILQNETETSAAVHPFIRDAAINVCDSMHNCGHAPEEIIQFAEKHLGGNDPGLITVLNNESLNVSNDGDNNLAIKIITRAVDLCKKLGADTREGLTDYIACRVSLAWFYAETDSLKAQDNKTDLLRSIAKDCETLLSIAENENNQDLINESTLLAANRLYNIAYLAFHYCEKNDMSMELVERAINLRQNVPNGQDEELNDCTELKEEIRNSYTLH